MRAEITVPTAPTRLVDLLPVFQSLAEAMVGAAVVSAEGEGRTVSCCKGCGACCRQMVPISETEARRMGEVVESLPEPRRSTVRARFAEGRRRLEEVGLLDDLLHRDRWDAAGKRSIATEYFRQGIACPFLEAESCSIYEDRPIACREYLVTSPAEECARPTAETIRCVELPAKVWTAVARFDEVDPSSPFLRWVPLILASEWAESHPEELEPRPAPDRIRELLERLTGASLPASNPSAEGEVSSSLLGPE